VPVIGEQEPLAGFLDHLLTKIHSVQRIGACHVLELILSSLMAGSNFTILRSPLSGRYRDGVHPTQPHSSAATQAGPRTRSNLVEHQFPEFPPEVVGNTTMNFQKFDDGWKIVASHSSTNEM
jgi:hypothetical protein